MSGIYADEDLAEKIDLGFGVFTDARQVTDIDERFVRVQIAADRVKDAPQVICGFYDL